MSDDLETILVILGIVLGGAVPVWLIGRRMRREFRRRYGRTPDERELTSIAAWMEPPPEEKPAAYDKKSFYK
jgi:hypothetical protein